MAKVEITYGLDMAEVERQVHRQLVSTQSLYGRTWKEGAQNLSDHIDAEILALYLENADEPSTLVITPKWQLANNTQSEDRSDRMSYYSGRLSKGSFDTIKKWAQKTWDEQRGYLKQLIEEVEQQAKEIVNLRAETRGLSDVIADKRGTIEALQEELDDASKKVENQRSQILGEKKFFAPTGQWLRIADIEQAFRDKESQLQTERRANADLTERLKETQMRVVKNMIVDDDGTYYDLRALQNIKREQAELHERVGNTERQAEWLGAIAQIVKFRDDDNTDWSELVPAVRSALDQITALWHAAEDRKNELINAGCGRYLTVDGEEYDDQRVMALREDRTHWQTMFSIERRSVEARTKELGAAMRDNAFLRAKWEGLKSLARP
jgi:hypothetical protein